MAYEINLTDDSATWTSPPPQVPLNVQTIEAAVDVVTLDLNMYTDLIATKRIWTVNWGTMSAADFTVLKAFYDRQFTLYKFPLLTISDLSLNNVVVRMTLSDQSITSASGLVDGVTATFRETTQTSIYYFVS
jgi:hypothetical protein